MVQSAFADMIAAARDELVLEIADCPDQVLEAQRLRYRVYCEERGFEPGENGLEKDQFDASSHHVLVSSRATGAVLGTVRVVMPKASEGHEGYPMRAACEPYVLAPLDVGCTGEISRFALTRDRAGVSPAAAALMRLYLMRGITEISGRAGLTHWCAIMETSLVRLLRATAIHFEPVGPTVEWHGTRQPVVGRIETILSRIRREQPGVWQFLTENGTLWREAAFDDAMVA